MLYSIKQFIKHGVHLGHYKWETDYRLTYYILGLRNSIHIINVYYTLFVLKQALSIAYNMCLIGQKIVVANDVGCKLNSNLEKINIKQLAYIHNKWIGGLLSNQREIFLRNEKIYFEYYGLGYDSILPSYVFGSSNIERKCSCVMEGIALSIPNSNLMDTNLGLYGVPYGLPSNDDNFVCVYFFTRLFIKMYFKSLFDNLNILRSNGYSSVMDWKYIYKSAKYRIGVLKWRRWKFKRNFKASFLYNLNIKNYEKYYLNKKNKKIKNKKNKKNKRVLKKGNIMRRAK